MDDAFPPLDLAAGFTPASRQDWLALVAKTLKGASAETLVGRTPDGLRVEPLYSPDNAVVRAQPARAGLRWDIRAEIPAGPDADAWALEALEQGATSLLVEANDGGADLARVLQGVATDIAPVALDAGFAGPAAARALNAVAKASPAAPLALHLDPLSAFAQAGASPGPVAGIVAEAAGLGATLAETYPKASLFLASGTVAHEAGATPAVEIAFAAAAAVAYAKALTGAGLSMAGAWERIVLGLACDADPIASMAKLRAARRVWARITRACDAPAPARIEVRASRRMLARSDHWTNLVRLTAAAFAGAAGGADAIVLTAFTGPLGGPPDALARRQARTIQLVLMEEAGLGSVADPAAGCWAIETQTDALAHAAWTRFAQIEGQGGLLAALQSGALAGAVEEGRAALAASLADGTLRMVGVTDFKPSEPAAPPAEPSSRATTAAPQGTGDHCPPLTPVRLEDLTP
jgi:methylmalonyl-CoA mutase